MKIETVEQYEAAMEEVSKLMALDPEKDSMEGQQLLALAKEIEDYEHEMGYDK